MQFTGFGNSIPDGEQFSQETRVEVAHIGGQVLTSEGQTCSLGTAFTTSQASPGQVLCYIRTMNYFK